MCNMWSVWLFIDSLFLSGTGVGVMKDFLLLFVLILHLFTRSVMHSNYGLGRISSFCVLVD